GCPQTGNPVSVQGLKALWYKHALVTVKLVSPVALCNCCTDSKHPPIEITGSCQQ
ncbi:hypothetical protein P7K49_028232, partial [Saguinus oedipus]